MCCTKYNNLFLNIAFKNKKVLKTLALSYLFVLEELYERN